MNIGECNPTVDMSIDDDYDDLPELTGRCESDSEDDDSDDEEDREEQDSDIQTNLILNMNAEICSHTFDLDMEDDDDLPELMPRCDSDSEDDASDYDEDSDDEDSDDDDVFSYDGNVASPISTTYEEEQFTTRMQQKAAPNRLVNYKKLQSVIETNLDVCPICK